jgi:hypothetical protein
MGKRFVPAHIADRRAIELYRRLRQIEQLPLVWMEIGEDHKTIHVGDKNSRRKQRGWTVDGILCLHPEEAVAKGGTYDDLMNSHRAPNKNRVPRVVVDEGVASLLSGEDE